MKVVISSTVAEVSVTVPARLSRFLAIWSMETVISSMVAEASVTDAGQGRAGLGHLLDGGAHLGDGAGGLLDVGGQALGVAGHGLDRGGHLLHRGRGLLGGLGLALGALGDQAGVGRDLARRGGHLHGGLLDVVHDAPQVGHHLVEALRQHSRSRPRESTCSLSVRSPLATAAATLHHVAHRLHPAAGGHEAQRRRGRDQQGGDGDRLPQDACAAGRPSSAC